MVMVQQQQKTFRGLCHPGMSVVGFSFQLAESMSWLNRIVDQADEWLFLNRAFSYEYHFSK